MTRILYWNIENFGVNKVNDPSLAVTPGHGGLSDHGASVWRRNLIIEHIGSLNPDIIVVVEVSTGAGGGDLVPNTGGLQGCQYLLNYLRGTVPYNGQDWRLVPPLVVGVGGVAESVAVFFRGTNGGVTRYFTGPNLYTGGYNGISVAPGVGAPPAVAYPQVFGNPDILSMLDPPGVAARNTPGNALHNPGVPENQLAARIDFLDMAAPPAWINFNGYRQPYMVTFTEAGGAPNPRHITLFACHAPPNNLPPAMATAAFMNTLPTMADIANAPAGGETKVICGDFNLPLLTAAGADANPYAPLTAPAVGYTRMLAPPGAGPPPAGTLDAYTGYFCTHIKTPQATQASRLLWSAPGNPSPYPGYGYSGSMFGANLYSIDNVLVNPAVGGQTLTIVNSVVGSPLNAVAPAPGGAPIGVDVFADDMLNIMHLVAWPDAPNAAPYGLAMAGSRRGWSNYRHIRNTSDHFALMAVV